MRQAISDTAFSINGYNLKRGTKDRALEVDE